MIKTIKLTKEQKDFLSQYVDVIKVAGEAFDLATHKHTRARDSLFEKLRKIFPDIYDKENPLSMKHPRFDHPDNADWKIIYWEEEKAKVPSK